MTGDEFLHMTKVLRYKEGFKAIILANDGIERLCTVDKIFKDSATLRVDSEKSVDKKGISLTLFAGNLKNGKLDLVIQKAVELGVDRVVPFISANCADDKFSLERAKRIALEAAKQCGSAYLSEVEDIISFDEVARRLSGFDCALFAYECERKTGVSAAHGKNIALIVGPEGGFTADEASLAVSSGAIAISLGRRILRAETASIVASALVLDRMGELDND